MDKAGRDNYSNQLNSNNDAYWSSRGQARPGITKVEYSQADIVNRGNQLNPSHTAYHSSRAAQKNSTAEMSSDNETENQSSSGFSGLQIAAGIGVGLAAIGLFAASMTKNSSRRE